MEAAPTCQLYSHGKRFQNQGQISKGLVESTRHITWVIFPANLLTGAKQPKLIIITTKNSTQRTKTTTQENMHTKSR